MKKLTYLLTYLLVIILVVSCSKHFEPSLEENSILENLKINQNVTLKNGILSADSKEAFLNLYEDVKSKGAESFFYEKIKPLQKFGFKPLRPYFKEFEEEEFKLFISRKKNKLKKNNQKKISELYKEDLCSPDRQLKTTESEQETIELDDYVIIDNNFAVILNDDREIIVEGKLYRYQGDGVFIVDEEKIPEFKLYIEGNEELNNQYDDNHFGKVEMKYDDTETGCTDGSGGATGGGSSTTVEPDFYEAKLNFGTSEFSKNPSIWGSIFGYARKQYVYLPDKKRIKLKFWNRNYVLFKSFGTEIRFQKKVSFLFISGWQKSYPTKIAMGVNHLQYNYDKGAETFLSPSVFNNTIYSFQGNNYYANGQRAPHRLPSVPFPVTELLGGTNGLNTYITNPFSEFDFEINLTPKQYANAINSASTQLLKLGIGAATSWVGLKPSSVTTVLTTKFYKNGTSLTISNKNWKKNRDNNITKFLDFSIPTITIRADIGAPGENFFSNPSVPFPTLSTDNYKTSSIDFYGAVLYKNVWYGVRMVSNDFKRK